MDKIKLKWKALPPSRQGSGRPSTWGLVRDALRSRPGSWAVVKTCKDRAQAMAYRGNLIRVFPKPEFELRMRGLEIYARHVKPAKRGR